MSNNFESGLNGVNTPENRILVPKINTPPHQNVINLVTESLKSYPIFKSLDTNQKTIDNLPIHNSDYDPIIPISGQGLYGIESYAETLDGTIALINKYLEISYNTETNDFEPVTMVFLDKSARNSAYLFRVMLQKLKNEGLIPDNLTPDIIFTNIGRDEPHKKNLISKFNPNEKKFIDTINKKVIIAHEYSSTGGTLQNSKDIFKQMLPNDSLITTFTVSKKLPIWFIDMLVFDKESDDGKGDYTDLSLKGVSDLVSPDEIDNTTEYQDYLNKYFGGFISVPYGHPFSDIINRAKNKGLKEDEISQMIENHKKVYREYRTFLKDMAIAYVDEIKKGS